MSGKALSLAIAVDVREAQRGVKDLSGALDDTASALDDLARDAQRGGDKIERALDDTGDAGKDAAQQIERGGDKIERTFRDMVRDAGKAEKAVEKVGDNGPANFDKVTDSAQELQNEIGQNLGGAVSSFSGDLTDLRQVGQDTLGGLAATVAGTGPAGLLGALALAAGAVGLGAVTAGLDEAKEKTEKLGASATEWAEMFEASAGRVINASAVAAKAVDIYADPERFSEAEQNAKDWGVTLEAAVQAMAGDTDALALAQDSLNGKTREWNDIVKETSTGSGNSWDRSTMTDQQRELSREIERGTGALALQNEAMAEGQRRAESQAKTLYELAIKTGEATEETDELGNKIYALPGGKEIVVDADTKTAYEDLDAIETYRMTQKRVRVVAEVDDSAWRNWQPTTKRGHVQAIGGKHVANWE